MKQPSGIQKLGCDKDCLKPCARSQQPVAKKLFKSQHKHQGFKFYKNILKDICFLDQCKKTQRSIIELQIRRNFKRFRDQIKRLQQKIFEILNTVMGSDDQSKQYTFQGVKICQKIQKLRKDDIQTLACNDIYLISKYLKDQKPDQSPYESKTQKQKRIRYELQASNQVKQLFSSFQYQLLGSQEINKILEDDVFGKQPQATNQNSFQRSVSQISMDFSEAGSEHSSHLSRVTSQQSLGQDQFEMEPNNNLSLIQYQVSEAELNNKGRNNQIQFSVVNQKMKRKDPPNCFKKNKNQVFKFKDTQSDEQLTEMVQQIGEQSRVLEAQQIEQFSLVQQNTQYNSSYHKYFRNDLSQQEQFTIALLRSKNQTQEVYTKSNALSFKNNYSSPSNSKKLRQMSQNCNRSQQQPYLMKISQVHKLTDKLYTSKQRFDVEVKVVALIDAMINRGYGNQHFRGSSIFFINFNQTIKPGMQIRLSECFINSYAESTNYQINSHCKIVTQIQQSKYSIKPNFSIMLSRLNHIKKRWNYELRNNLHFKVVQIALLYRKQFIRQVLLKKCVIVTVLKKINRNQYLVGDYTGRMRLHVEDKLFITKKLDIKQNDTLNIIKAMIQKSHLSYEDDTFQINTNHQHCVIYNLRNHNIKFHKQFIPED